MRRSRSRTRVIGILGLAVLATGCSVASLPSVPSSVAPTPTSTATPTPTPPPPPTPPPTPTPTASTNDNLGPIPTLLYPEVQSLGTGTVTLTAPQPEQATFWVTCEWGDTSRVHHFHPEEGVELLGERVSVSFHPEGPRVDIRRAADRAPYFASDETLFELTRVDDWTSGAIAFTDLPINVEAWGLGPLPTPKAAFEQPLGGRHDARHLDGTVTWQCGAMPATVPTPGPSQPEFSEPPLPDLPNALLSAGDRRVEGVVGCGMSWSLDGELSGGESCATTWAAPGVDRVLEVDAGDTLRFHVPEGVVFEEWALFQATQADSDYSNGLTPPLEQVTEGRNDESISVPAPPPGEWVLLLSWDGSDDRWELQDVGDHFRVVVR